MSGALTRCRVSAEQLHALLSFMEEHRDFAACKQSIYSRFSACKLWRLLAVRLNALADEAGGAHKSPDKWSRYWADIKYRARKKWAAGESLGDLSSVEERLQSILGSRASDLSQGVRGSGGGGTAGGASAALSDDERRLDEDMYSEQESGEAPRLATEELLAEAAMRSALAAEKQAEAVAQGVELLRDLVALLRERPPPPPPPEHALAAMQHHHHQL